MNPFNQGVQLSNRKTFKIILTILVLSITFAGGVFLGSLLSRKEITLNNGRVEILNNEPAAGIKTVNFDLFWQTWDLLFQKYLKASEIDPQKLLEGAISGMVKSLDDPYTAFFNPEELAAFKDQMAGKYEGIGIEMGFKDGQVVVVSPFGNSPASKKGIKSGDYILMVDDKKTEGLSLSEVAGMIRGPKGSNVKLILLHEGEKETYEVEVTREEIVYDSVSLEMKGEIAQIRILHFADNTNTEWDKAVKEAISKNPKGIVLDLRNNPGGYVNSAVYIAGDFVKNDVITKEKFASGNEQILRSEGTGRLARYPLVILVNEGTASASEILAGALQYYKLGELVGKKTFGKGIVQEEVGLSQESALHVTTAEWLLPSGDNIHQKGLTPDIEIDLSDDDFKAGKDPQLKKALELLNSPQ